LPEEGSKIIAGRQLKNWANKKRQLEKKTDKKRPDETEDGCSRLKRGLQLLIRRPLRYFSLKSTHFPNNMYLCTVVHLRQRA
jgi:hypothetical protein